LINNCCSPVFLTFIKVYEDRYMFSTNFSELEKKGKRDRLMYHRSTCLRIVPRYFHRFNRDSLIRLTFEAAWHERKPAVTAHRALDSLISFAIPGRPRATPIADPQTRCAEGTEKKFRWRRKFALLARPIFENARERKTAVPPVRQTDAEESKKTRVALSCLLCVISVIYFSANHVSLNK